MAEAAEIRQRTRPSPGRRHGLQLLEAVGNIITQSHDLRASAQGVVETVAEHLGMEVCSIYAYKRESNVLTLWATTGLDPASVGRVTMSVDEG
ncbi:MAG TPA: hypothetical protein VMT89_10935, partial [Candidatus Acidoferrales bacterium]|nr:hypothetical protein [Candidatus Acidoferrales bacterium]